MAEYIQYITKDGDRWDTISQKVYGTPWKGDDIIEANPNVKIEPVLTAGIVLEILVIPEAAVQTPMEMLPPWKK